jgi:diacylglycerol kinase family enzyme
MFKKPHIIINPAAGREEPILSLLNNAFREKKIHWDVSITQGKNDATTLTTKAHLKPVRVGWSPNADDRTPPTSH